MQLWQIALLVLIVALPLALMADFWGDQRLSSRGEPRRREWRPSPRPAPDEEHH